MNKEASIAKPSVFREPMSAETIVTGELVVPRNPTFVKPARSQTVSAEAAMMGETAFAVTKSNLHGVEGNGCLVMQYSLYC